MEPLDVMIPRLEARVKADANDKASAMQLAQAYLAANRPDLALGLTQKLLAGGTKTAQIYFLDGAADAGMNKLKEATASLEQASNMEPTNMAVLSMLTTVYMRDNRPADAERVAKRALTFNKDTKAAYENYGFFLAAVKRYDEAREQFQTAAKLDPKDAHPIVLQARTYQEQNAIALAAQLYDRAISVDANSMEALLGKAEVAALQHNVKDAVATYETVLKLQNNDYDRAAVVAEIGKVYAQEKMDQDADAAFRRAIDSYPSVVQTHVVYGDYLNARGDKAGAEREWNLGLGANRDNPEALIRVGDLAMQAKNYDKAIELYKRLTELAPGDPRSHLALANGYMGAKNYPEAQKSYKQSYAIEHTPDALVGLGEADIASKNFTEAVQIYEAIDKGAPDLIKQAPFLLYEMGQSYQGINQPQKAREAYARLLGMLQPNSSDYNQVKGLIDAIDRGRGSVVAPARPPVRPSPTPPPKK
jgi:tetratricopeptide (TPR) repeat protein